MGMPEDFNRALSGHVEVGIDCADDWDLDKQDFILRGIVTIQAWAVADKMFDPWANHMTAEDSDKSDQAA